MLNRIGKSVKILITKEKLINQICVLPSIDVLRLNVDGVNRYDLRFFWLKWGISIGNIKSAIEENIYNKL